MPLSNSNSSPVIDDVLSASSEGSRVVSCAIMSESCVGVEDLVCDSEQSRSCAWELEAVS